MLEILNLVLPFFGLILIGYVSGKLAKAPDSGLAWMNFFIIYVALPALFFRILAKTPFEQLAQARFVLATTIATALVFAIAFAIARTTRAGTVREATIAGLAGAYGNIGYMGPGLALAALGQAAAVPVALIFCFDTLLLFSLVPTLMAFGGPAKVGFFATIADVLKRILLHPLLVSAGLGILAAALDWQPPLAAERLLEFLQNSAAPTALFTLGVTIALRPLQRLPRALPLLTFVKLIAHPLLAYGLLGLLGPFPAGWAETALLMAALPPALNVFVFARQYETWIEPASTAVLIGTLASVVTLTLALWLIKSHTLAEYVLH